MVGFENVGNVGNGDICGGVFGVDDVFSFDYLKSVYDDIDDGLRGVGIEAFGVHYGNSAAESFGQSGAYLLRVYGDYHCGF